MGTHRFLEGFQNNRLMAEPELGNLINRLRNSYQEGEKHTFQDSIACLRLE